MNLNLDELTLEMFSCLQEGPLPLCPLRLELPLHVRLHHLPLVLRRPGEPHEVAPRESPVLLPEELLHLFHVLHPQPETMKVFL